MFGSNKKCVIFALSNHNQTNHMNTLQQISDLRNQLDLLYSKMPQTFFQQKMRDKAAFEISKQIEQLENPTLYAENKMHWELHELRF